MASLAIFFLVLLSSVCMMKKIDAQTVQPNIVFILTDDQDTTLQGMDIMTQTKKLIIDQGMTFNNAFVSSPICCISRSSYLSGRYVHNNHCIGNGLGQNCSSIWWQTNIEPYCYAPSIQSAGYLTFYAGKYLNQYGNANAGGVAHIPKGWSHWYGLVGNSKYYNYKISDNGVQKSFGHNYTADYYTDIIHAQAIDFIDTYYQNHSANIADAPPFLMVMATPSAHAPFTPAPQYNNTYANIVAPRTPNWNNIEVNLNKHDLLQMVPRMNATIVAQSDQIFRFRAGTLQSVDDMIADVHSALETYNLLSNTYFLYTSDHGFHSGQYGMGFDKRQLYENDIRIPFYMSGPGIPANSHSDRFVLNIDVAPTLVDLATGYIPSYMDGRSFKPFFDERRVENGNGAAGIEQQFLIEYFGEGNPVANCGNGIAGFQTQICDSVNNTYRCARVINGTNGEVNGTIFCNFLCFSAKNTKEMVDCPAGTPQGDGEYYELDTDYFELNNVMNSLSDGVKKMYQSMIDAFMACAGQTQCNALREGN